MFDLFVLIGFVHKGELEWSLSQNYSQVQNWLSHHSGLK